MKEKDIFALYGGISYNDDVDAYNILMRDNENNIIPKNMSVKERAKMLENKTFIGPINSTSTSNLIPIPPPIPSIPPSIPPPIPTVTNSIQTQTHKPMYDITSPPTIHHHHNTQIVRDSFPYSAYYNKLYTWSLGLLPEYYSYAQRNHILEILKPIIMKELTLSTPTYLIENMIHRIVNQYSSPIRPIEIKPIDIPAVKKKVSRKSKKSNKKVSKKSNKKVSKKSNKKVSKKPKKVSKKPKKKVSKKN
jgi:hypothetical protein